MPITFQRSSGQQNTKSFCAARNRFVPSGRPAFGIVGVVPVWGFGKFDASSAYNSLVYQEVWPFVYKTLTETWVETGGLNRTKTTEFSQYVDVYSSTTDSGGTPSVASIISTTVTDTSVTVTYWCDGLNINSGTYTATVSNVFDPGSLTDGWTTRANQSSSLCAKLNINDIPQDFWTYYPAFPPAEQWGGFPVFPVSYGGGWSVGRLYYANPGRTYIGTLYDSGLNAQKNDTLLAAAYGMGMRSFGSFTGSRLLTETLAPFEASVIDNMSLGQLALLGLSVVKNHGAIITAKYGWALSGTAQASNPNTNNHLNVYKQSLRFDGSNAPYLTSASAAGSLPFGLSNPIAAGTYVEFGELDVYNNCYDATDNPEGFGVLGFRSTAD